MDAETIRFCIDQGILIGAIPGVICLLAGLAWRVIHIMS